jgi:DNA-binding SARP family transcriptional activator
MRFAIMQGEPGYRPDEATPEEPIGGQEGIVLRVLILHQGRSLTKDEIARHLTRCGKRAVSASSVPGYIARLRRKIGQDRIRSTAGYTSAIDPADVDAFAFEKAVEEYDLCNVADVDSLDREYVDMYDKLLDLYAMWRANPALPFLDDQEDDYLASRYLDFERYWDCLRRCIIYAELLSRRKPRIEKAISRIDQLLAQDPHDEQSWALLFRARASLPGGEAAASSMLPRIRDQFAGGIPGELAYTVNRIISGHSDALFEFDRGQRSRDDQQRVNQLIHTIGVSSASELELRRSKLEPLECISQTVSQLRFSGILATKWVADSYVLARFTRLLERLDHSGGSVRFLLLDPESESYRKFSELRWSPASVQSIDVLRRLSAVHPSFAVRLYDALPTFRIVLIDQSIVSFSPYLMDRAEDRARTGWEAPHIVLDRTAPWPLAHTFDTLFGETWRTATPLLP